MLNEDKKNNGKEEFRKFKEFLNLEKIEVYGHVEDVVLRSLSQKAQMLGKGTVKSGGYFTGFYRSNNEY